MNDTFSKRNGFKIPDKKITIREDAPHNLRDFIPNVYYGLNIQPSTVRKIVCQTLRVSPDKGNWGEYPYISQEVQSLLSECEWFKVYDIIERLACNLRDPRNNLLFHEEINSFFCENGIGWKLITGRIELRGDEDFETAISVVEEVLEERGIETATTEIKEAILDLSRRPNADTTGAIQHSLAALECIARTVTGASGLTLGALIKKHKDIVPPPLDSLIEKMWGFSSEQGRHLREGEEPHFEEAELLVHLSASICTYLGKKNIQIKENEIDDSPF